MLGLLHAAYKGVFLDLMTYTQYQYMIGEDLPTRTIFDQLIEEAIVLGWAPLPLLRSVASCSLATQPFEWNWAAIPGTTTIQCMALCWYLQKWQTAALMRVWMSIVDFWGSWLVDLQRSETYDLSRKTTLKKTSHVLLYSRNPADSIVPLFFAHLPIPPHAGC